MPLVIDEVVISVEVAEQGGGAGGGGAEGGGGGAGAPAAGEDRQALVAECVERVLEVLREREER
jgi:Family of unknown function (DUF5908)